MGIRFWSGRKRDSFSSSDDSSVFDSAPTTLSMATITEEDFPSEKPRPTSCYITRPLLEETLCLSDVDKQTKDTENTQRPVQTQAKASPQTPQDSPKLNKRRSLGLSIAQKLSRRISGSHLNKDLNRVSGESPRPKSAIFHDQTEPVSHRPLSSRNPPVVSEIPIEQTASKTYKLVEMPRNIHSVLLEQPSISTLIEPRPTTRISTFYNRRPLLSSFTLPIKNDQVLKIKIFVVSSTTGTTSDVMALKLKKQKLENINELIQVIQFKVGFRFSALDTSDIKLSIFFKNPKLRPIPLNDSAGRSLDTNGLTMDYILAKDKLYVKADTRMP